MNNFFKEFYNKILYRKYKVKAEEVRKLSYGDEIYCFIDDNKELLKVENDQIANFIYLTFKLPYIYCLYKSDSKKKGFYKLNDSSHVDINKVYKIHIKNYISIKNNQTTKKDFEDLSKKIKFDDLFVKRTVTSKASISVGDIIERKNNKYFVSEIVEGGLIAYQIYYHKGTNYIYLINNMYIDKTEPSYIIRDYYFYSETNLVNLDKIIVELKENDHMVYENIKYYIHSTDIEYYSKKEVYFNLFVSIKENLNKFIELLLSINNYIIRLINNVDYKPVIGKSP